MSYFTTLQNATGITDVFFERPQKYNGALSLAQELLREPSYLSALDRELIAAYTSYLNECEYCYTSHKEFAKSLGATDEDLAIFYETTSHRLHPILEYVKKLTKNPSSLTQEDKNKVISLGFTESELKDAIAVCAIFNFYNRIVEGHGIKANDSYEFAAKRINDHGYDNRY